MGSLVAALCSSVTEEPIETNFDGQFAYQLIHKFLISPRWWLADSLGSFSFSETGLAGQSENRFSHSHRSLRDQRMMGWSKIKLLWLAALESPHFLQA